MLNKNGDKQLLKCNNKVVALNHYQNKNKPIYLTPSLAKYSQDPDRTT